VMCHTSANDRQSVTNAVPRIIFVHRPKFNVSRNSLRQDTVRIAQYVVDLTC